MLEEFRFVDNQRMTMLCYWLAILRIHGFVKIVKVKIGG